MDGSGSGGGIEPLIFLTTCQPHLKQCNGPRHATTLLTLEEKRAFVDEMDTRRMGFIPATIDHAGGELPGASARANGRFEVAGQLQIGRFVDALISPKGDLVGVGEVWHDRPEAAMLADDIRSGRNDPAAGHRPWGASLCTNLDMDADMTMVHAKRVTHIGITRDPAYGPEGTLMHLAATTWPTFYRRLKEDFLDKEQGWYVPPALQRRIAAATAAPAPVLGTGTGTAPPNVADGPSESAARLPVAAAAPAAAIAPSHSFIAPMSTSDAAVTAPAAASASAGGAPSGADRQLLLERKHRELEAFIADIAPKDAGNGAAAGEILYDADRLVRAKRLIDDYSGLLAGVSPNQWGADMFARLSALEQYIGNAQRVANTFVDEHYKPNVAADELARYKQAVQDPLNTSNYQTAVQVFATRNILGAQAITNQRSMESRLLQVNLESEKVRADLAAERDSLKKKRDEWEKEREELQAKLAELGKRQRVDAPAAPASAPAGAAAAAKTVSIDVGATGTLPPYCVNGRVVATSAFLEGLTPRNLPAVTLNTMKQSQFMAPWMPANGTDQNKALKEMLDRLRS